MVLPARSALMATRNRPPRPPAHALRGRWRNAGVPDLALSLRLYDSDGRLAAQADGGFSCHKHMGAPGEPIAAPALPLPVSLKPGSCRTEVVVYGPTTARPPARRSAAPSRDTALAVWERGDCTCRAGAGTTRPLATFDHLELVDVQLDRTKPLRDSGADDSLLAAASSPYRDSYRANIALHAVDGSEAQAGVHPGRRRGIRAARGRQNGPCAMGMRCPWRSRSHRERTR